MARKIKLTDTRIGKLKSGNVEYMVWDTRIAGFGVRVRPTGHKSYVYHRHVEGQSRKFTFGSVALGSRRQSQARLHGGLGQDAIGETGGRRRRRAGSVVPGLRRGIVENGVL